MKTITEIKPQKKSAKRCNIYLDGEFFCGMELITVMKNRLKVGMQVSEKELENLVLQSEKETAFNLAISYVSNGMRTKVQVVKYLKGKGFLGGVIYEVVEKLINYGYVNDEIYSKNYLNQRKNVKGKRLLMYELKMKGVDQETIDKAVEQAPSEEDGAYLTAQKFMKGKAFDYENLSKCYRRLLSKGFDYDLSKSIIDRLKRENEYSED